MDDGKLNRSNRSNSNGKEIVPPLKAEIISDPPASAPKYEIKSTTRVTKVESTDTTPAVVEVQHWPDPF